MSLGPELTQLDRRVLHHCGRRGGVRARRVHGQVYGRYEPARVSLADVRGILRGLEHLGYVEQRNGWWRRTDRGQRILEAM